MQSVEVVKVVSNYHPNDGHHSLLPGPEQPVKFGAAHFTKGTLIEVRTPGLTHPIIVEVDVVDFRFDSIIIQSTAVHGEGHILEGHPYTFLASWVSRIIRRETGEIKQSQDYRSMVDFSKIRDHVSIHDLPFIIRGMYRESEYIPECFSSMMDICKLSKRLGQMGALLPREVIDENTYRGPQMVDLKKVKKFLKKNPHWMFRSLRSSSAISRVEWEEELEEDWGEEDKE